MRILLSRYRIYLICPECGGDRFRKEVSQYVVINGFITLPGLYALSISDAILWFKDTFKTLAPDKATQRLLEEINSKFSTLEAAGLGYLTLDRQSRTLSGGEVARIAISRAIGTNLTQTLYVLDEPTAGLHPADRWRLIGLISRLKARGGTRLWSWNTTRSSIMVADTVVELGPGSGGQGGRITYLGPARPDNGRLDVTIWPKREPDHDASARLSQKITITGAKANNLKEITVSFPLNSFTCLTGVSGSGKSTLLELVLYRGLLRDMGLPSEPPGGFSSIIGAEHVNEVYLVGQSSIGRTPRACPASYLHILDGIRTLFYGTKAARALGLSKGDFSFNSGSGRCPVCNGQGAEVIEMQFLPDITLPCPACKGKRFKNDILSVIYKGKNIFDILQMTIDEAASFFEDIRYVTKAIVPSMTLGLGYLRLGQQLSTLSPGEAQRLKLAGSFASSSGTKGLFLLDEPSRGLGDGELRCLLKAIHGLLERGHAILAVEHEPGLVAAADWVIDLGPYGGAEKAGGLSMKARQQASPDARSPLQVLPSGRGWAARGRFCIKQVL